MQLPPSYLMYRYLQIVKILLAKLISSRMCTCLHDTVTRTVVLPRFPVAHGRCGVFLGPSQEAVVGFYEKKMLNVYYAHEKHCNARYLGGCDQKVYWRVFRTLRADQSDADSGRDFAVNHRSLARPEPAKYFENLRVLFWRPDGSKLT